MGACFRPNVGPFALREVGGAESSLMGRGADMGRGLLGGSKTVRAMRKNGHRPGCCKSSKTWPTSRGMVYNLAQQALTEGFILVALLASLHCCLLWRGPKRGRRI
eukprot:1157036-Pelagomonas_calceolata.AAC.4